MPTVTGFIRLENNSPALKATVKAFDKDLRHEQFLGEAVIEETSGRFEIRYTADQFRRAEKRNADLIIRAWDEDGNLRAESDIIFNAPDVVTVNLTFSPLQARLPSEFERLVSSLQPVLENIEPAELTQNDIAFLTGETRQPRQNIEFLQQSASLNLTTHIPTEAFYGWARRNLPLELNRLLKESAERLLRELGTAIQQQIIPNITNQLDEIAARLAALRIESGLLIRRDFTVKLIERESGEALVGYTVRALDLDATPKPEESSSDVTDGQGLATVTYYLLSPPSPNIASPNRRLELTIISPAGKDVSSVQITASPQQQEPIELRVAVPSEPDASPAIDALQLSADVVTSLRTRKISTVADLRRAGGVRGVDGLDTNDPNVRRLESHVQLSTLTQDAKDAAVLIEKGFDSPLKIANTPRAEFVRTVSALGDFKAARLQAGARAQVKVFNNAVAGFLTDKASGHAGPGFLSDLDKTAGEDAVCHCKDCEAAVSPAAYLADLIDYAITHVKIRKTNKNPPPTFDYDSINLRWLDDNLHQRFGDLPTSCEAVEERVRQVRICCGVLRRLIKSEDSEGVNLISRTKHYRESAYRALLSRIGTSYDELREVVKFGTGEKKKALADRLAILPEHLDELFIELKSVLSGLKLKESWLEKHFGLVSTLRDPLAKGNTPLLVTWRLEYLRELWHEIDFPVNAYTGHALPVIDPDLIGPDDFRRPQLNDPAFTIWRKRRTFVDNLITNLTETLTTDGFDAAITQVFGEPKPNLIGLKDQLDSGKNLPKLKEQLDKLNLTPETLIRLAEIEVKAESGTPLDGEEVADAVNILAQVEKLQQSSAWIAEEKSKQIRIDPRVFWTPLQEPQEGEWPPVRINSVPLLDPQKLGIKDLAEPTAGGPAHATWQARIDELEKDHVVIKETHEADGFDGMLSVALGHPNPGDPLQHDPVQIQADLISPDEAIVASAKEKITNDLKMTVEDFNFLMVIRVKSANPDPKKQPTAEEWNKTYALLTAAHKRKHRYPVWLVEEAKPALNAYWKILKARLPRWRAAYEARQLWQQALHMQSQPPLIDPDLLQPEDIVKTKITEPPYSLWKARKIWVSDQLGKLKTLRENAATLMAGLDEILTDEASVDMPVVGMKVAALLALADQREQGEAITARLQQLPLGNDAFNYLLHIIDKVQTEVEVSESEWHDVDSILIQVAKRRLFAEWRREEEDAKLHLGSTFFHFLDKPSMPVPEWRATAQARRAWDNTLRSRIEQAQAAISALQEAVNATEEETLTLLRDALISATDVEGATPYEKSKWITDNLLIDARASGCQTTTRVAQAIETLQTLLWGIRTGQLSDSQPDWILDADSFDDEWSWIGSYATWRSAMFVFLYPENLALPSLRKYQTPPFREIVERGRNARATPEAACRFANEFAEYFKDVCHLSLEASCRASTRMHDDDPCQNASAEYRLLYYLFARSKSSDKVYWSTYDFRNHSGHAQTLWDAVRGLEGTTKIVGAVPYGGFVFLFVERRNEAGGKELVFTKYDLETLAGWDAPQVVGLPSGMTALRSAVVAQRSSSAAPPLLIINAREESEKYGQVFYRIFTLDETKSDDKDEGENGAAGDWTQLDLTIPGQRNLDRLLALYRFKSGYCLIARYTRNTGESRDYRTHLFNAHLNEQNPGEPDSALGTSKYWRGGWSWPGTNIVVIFEGKTPRYEAFRLSADLKKESTFSMLAHSINFASLGLIAAHCDDDDSGVAMSHIVVAHSMGSGIYLSVLERDLDNNLPNRFRVERRIPVAPQVVLGTFDIPVRLSETERLIRWLLINSVFASHKNFPESVMTYLREAYYFLPMQLALQLQQSGHYTAALDWFRTVYDYSLPPNQRKIYHGLKAEESLGNTFGRAKDWLLDPMNPHAIAATRANSYTRFTLLSIIRCLLDYADNEFTRDTAESVPRARTLYLTALGLLEAKELKQEKNACDKIMGSLQIDVGESWQKAVGVALAGLNKVGSVKKLRSAADAIKRVAADGNLDDEEKVFRITSAVAAARDGASTPMTIAVLTSISKEKITNLYTAMLANPLLFREATESAKIAEDYFVEGVASVSSLQPTELKEGKGDLKWLREPMPTATQSREAHALAANKITPLTFVSKTQSMPMVALNSAFGVGQHYTPKPSIGFCIPPNPVRDSLRMRAELNLLKLRQCRNIAGVVRELEPYAAPTDTFSGMPLVDMGGRLSLPGVSVLKPTPYKYKVLIEHAKELVQLAGQIEGAMLGALEKRDAEAYQVLRARQELNLARAGIQLQNLRVREARSSVTLAELQRDRAQIQFESYEDWINTGLSELENQMLDAYNRARDAQLLLSRLSTATQIAQAAVTAATADYSAAAAWLLFAGFTQVALLEITAKGDLIRAESTAQIASVRASFERRQQEWELQRSLAEQDVKIGDQQIQLANEHVDVVEQEREIAVMQVAHAKEILDFLTNKFTNVELYDWMSNVLEGVYSFFLQRATGMAKVAENQLAFERQEITPAFIESDYWETPDSALGPANGNRRVPDRRGLTGSARLLQDIYQLDQYAFETDRRKLQLSRVVSLAQLAPVEFQRFRETGVITFATPMGFFDRDFPGHYLRLIKQVRTSIIALIPPTLGVKATLSTTGTSRVIIGGDVFQVVNVSRGLESVALSSPFNATGLFELNPQPDMLLPFEGIGVDTTWEFHLPKASNPFDYSTIADVLITIDYTAMNSYEYRQQVIQQLDTSISIDRAFSFRHQFADAWYDLNNPDQTATPMVVRFQTQRADLPPGIEDLRIQHVVLYFVRQAEASFEINVSHLRFTEESGMMAGGGATSIDGIISTRRGNAGSWIPIIGKTPTGQWELALPNTEEMKRRFKDEEIENILLVLSYSGQTPAFQ